MILAAIDIGSNAARLLITDVHNYSDGSLDYTKLNLIRVPLRLGFDVFTNNSIGTYREKMMIDTMHAFKKLMEVYEVKYYKAAATSALRDASNGKQLVKKISALCGIDIAIISGQQEADIIYENHTAEKLQKNYAHLYVDVGGGSTEISLFHNGQKIGNQSFNLGTIRILKNLDNKTVWNDLKNYVKTNTAHYKNIDAIGSGGNINKIFSLSKKKKSQSLNISEINDYLKIMQPLSVAERMHKFDLKEDRADVIVPALQIYTSVLRWANIDNMFVPQIGMADGLIKVLYKEVKDLHLL
jgi:exopolyphosphatase/guanosine-5'-triphosphate,3'-diphosphate pyrophosphatase